MPRLSIIIPVLGTAAEMERTLVTVLQHRPRDCEILAVLNAPYDDPYEVAEEVRFIEAGRKASFVECVNAGLQAAKSPIIHTLAAGFEICEGWTEPALEHFTDRQVAAVAPLVVSAADNAKTLAAGLRYSAGGKRIVNAPHIAPHAGGVERVSVLGPCGAAAFYRRAALLEVGGFPKIVGNDLADVQLSLQLQRAGYRAVFDARSEVSIQQLPTWHRSGVLRGFYAERLFWLHAAEQGWTKAMALHPAAIVGDILGHLPSPTAVTQLLGRLWACCQLGFYRRASSPAAPEKPMQVLPSTLRIDPAHTQETVAPPVKQPQRASRRAA